MNYIYDILLNFHEVLYDFYDWNPNDNIINIRKIPIIKIPSNQLHDIKENNVRFSLEFLKQIENKTERFSSKDIKNISYCFLLSDATETIGILIKNNTLKKSHLLIDEDLEVLEVATRLKEEKIDYQIIKPMKQSEFKTRKEMDLEKIIYQNLKKLKEENALQQLKYLYYECFNEKEENPEKILSKIEQTLKKQFDTIANKLEKFFELIHTTK